MNRIALLLLAACGPSGGFRLQNRNYTADKITAQPHQAADGSKALEGFDVSLRSDPISSATDDEVAVVVSVYWNADQRPELNKEMNVGSDLAVRAVARVGCFCGAKDTPVLPPQVKGKFKLTQWSDKQASGDFDLTFTGQVPFVDGGVLFDDDTLKVNASGFILTR